MFGKIIPPVINTRPRKVKPVTQSEVKNEQRSIKSDDNTERSTRDRKKRKQFNKKEKDTDSI